MALVDTSTLSIAVERSILGPQGRRWIERKLPEIASTLSFIAVSGFGACLLMYQVCRDYGNSGLAALLQLPKHLANAVVLHFLARLLRWHVGRVATASFAHGDASFPFASASPRGMGGGAAGRSSSGASAVGGSISWPWQAASSTPAKRRESSPSDSDGSPPRSPQLSRGGSGSAAHRGGNGGISSPFGGDHTPGRGSRESSGPRSPPPERVDDNIEILDDREVAEALVLGTAANGNGNSSAGGGGGGGSGEEASPEHTNSSATAITAGAAAATTAAAVVAAGAEAAPPSDDGTGAPPRERVDVSISRQVTRGVSRALGRGGGGSGGGGGARRRGGGGRPASGSAASRFYLEEHAAELADGGCFFIKMIDDDSWLFVEDELHQPDWGWTIRLFHRGYAVTVRYPGQVGRGDADRMLFQCEPSRRAGYVRLRSRGTNTYLFFLGVKRPLTFCAWDREVVGGDWEDFKISWCAGEGDAGRVVLRSWATRGFVQWTGTRFIHTASRESATRFMLQRLG